MNNQQQKSFLSAGKATFTLHSTKTDVHYTFKVIKSDDGKLLWVRLLTDGDKYIYLGTVVLKNWEYKQTSRSQPGPLHGIMAWFFTGLKLDRLSS